MAKMYGKFDRTTQNSKGWTKAARRHDEERQIAKDLASEDHSHGPSIFEVTSHLLECPECRTLYGIDDDWDNPKVEGHIHG